MIYVTTKKVSFTVLYFINKELKMTIKKNVGLADRILRLGAGLMMIYFGFINTSAIADQFAAILLGILGIIFLLTAIFSMCPFYNVIGINTCSDHKHNENK